MALFGEAELDAVNQHAPFEFMRFRLTYDGPLSSGGNSSRKLKQKWAIRRAFHPQLEQLCRTHPVLNEMVSDSSDNPYFPPINVQGHGFLPIVRRSINAICDVDILLMRKEERGALILQGGDIDNRLKILFDALRMPSPKGEEVPEGEVPYDPMFFLLESDALIMKHSVDTDRLLSSTSSDVHEVRVVIEVKVSLTQVRLATVALLGD